MRHEHKTLNNLPSNTREKARTILNNALAMTIDLALATKQAHWNVKGPRFIMIHRILDDFREDLDEHVDTIAERIAQLGGTAYGTLQAVAKATKLAPYPANIYTVEDHLMALIERYSKVANLVRGYIDEAIEIGDANTADIFTAASRSLDKNLWFLEAHIQEAE